MDPEGTGEGFVERRSAPRTIIDDYYSVEFAIEGIPYNFQFKIWNVSHKGACLVVKEDSVLLNHLKVGDIVKMKYYKPGACKPNTEFFETEIRHITEDDKERFSGHYLVGISILDS